MDNRCIELSYAVENLEQWFYKQEEKIINIVTIPYNTNKIFRKLIRELVVSEKKVLYVTEEINKNLNMIKFLKSSINSSTYRKKGENLLNYFQQISIDRIYNIDEEYELIIYDDISTFSKRSKLEILDYIDFLYKRGRKLIIYSVEEICKNSYTLKVGRCDYRSPFVEPRFITTRIDLSKDIPYIIYDYLKWFKENNRRVIIHTPNEEYALTVYNYYKNILGISNKVKLILFIDEEEYRLLANIDNIKDRSIMIITNQFGKYFEDIDNIDILIYFADNKIYDYKKLIYMCGKVGKNKERPGEILFLSNEISQAMEIAKEMARNFNKNAWEKGLLN